MGLYNELMKATNNVDDITHEKFGIVTNVDNGLCNVTEYDDEMEHLNVEILNGFDVRVGDKVVLGFVDNNFYNPIITGVIGRKIVREFEGAELEENGVLNISGVLLEILNWLRNWFYCKEEVYTKEEVDELIGNLRDGLNGD